MSQTATLPASSDMQLRVFWQPGCSSCVKVKELLSSMDVPFKSVNILEDKEAMTELMTRGIRSVPVLIQGERAIYAQSLDDVAKFVGRDRNHKRLPAPTLMERWLTFLTVSRELIAKVQPEKLETRPVAERARSIRQLSYHIFQIPESVLESVETGLADTRDISNASYDHLRTTDDLLAYADTIIARMKAWQAGATEASFAQTIDTYYGKQPMMQVLERGTWHSGQHARQLDLVVSDLTGAPKAIPPGTYAGLPMPEGVWA